MEPLVAQLAAPAHRVPILTYHNIGTAPPATTHRGLYLAPERFRDQLRVLAAHGYRGVSMSEGLAHLRGERSDKVAILTFDDGYADNLEAAAPLLRERGFGATCYLVADRIGGFNAWDSELLGVKKPLMDLGGIRDWIAMGMAVGSHTRTHPRLSRLPRAQMREEVFASKAALEDRLGLPVDHFCYPYGDYDEACVDAVREAGYATAVTIDRGRVRRGDRLAALPRVGNSGKRSRRVFDARALWWRLAPRA